MSPRQRIAAVTLAVALAVALGYAGLRSLRRLPVSVCVVREGPPSDVVALSGQIEALRRADVAPRFAGVVEDIMCQVGDAVREGQELARMSAASLRAGVGRVPRTPEERLAQARTDLQEAQRAARTADRKLGMLQARLDERASELQSVDEAQADLDEAESAQEQAERELRKLETADRWREVAAATRDLQQAREALTGLQKELAQAQTLYDQGTISRDELDAVERRQREAAQRHEAAKNRLAAEERDAGAQELRDARAKLDRARSRVAGARLALQKAEEGESELADLQARIAQAQADLGYSEQEELAAEGRLHLLERGAEVGAPLAPASELDTGYLTAPISGTVLAVHVKPKAEVKADQPVVTVGDLSSLILRLKRPAAELARVRVGQSAEVTVSETPEHDFSGVVSRAEATDNGATKTVELILTDPWGLLRPGMQADAAIEIRVQERGFVLPVAAVALRPGGHVVFVVEGSRVRAEPVRVLSRSGQEYRVAGALNRGDLAVLDPPAELKDGRAVAVVALPLEASEESASEEASAEPGAEGE